MAHANTLNPLTDKNARLVTCGIFYCRASACFSVSASNKLSCNLTGQPFEIGNKNIRVPLATRRGKDSVN
jgi:hypothetical protein